jgi:hypothetical protein
MTANKKYFYIIVTTIIFALVLVLGLSLFQLFLIKKANAPENSDLRSELQITNFGECVNAGNPIMKSNPRQCQTDGKIFTE